MDRLSRDMLDYLQFARDMAALGKVIINVSDGTDTSTERGRQQLEDRILAAQREREKMAARRRKAARRLSDEGRWGGGVDPLVERGVDGFVVALEAGQLRDGRPERVLPVI